MSVRIDEIAVLVVTLEVRAGIGRVAVRANHTTGEQESEQAGAHVEGYGTRRARLWPWHVIELPHR